MASLRDIKKRIGSVKNTQKITKAMKMVAAAKLRRAQMAVIGSRPYSDKLKEVVMDIVAKSSSKGRHPLFKAREEVKTVRVLVFASNRGLCGGFNSNLLRRLERFLREIKMQGKSYEIHAIGKKARDYLTARKYEIKGFYAEWADALDFDAAVELTEKTIAGYVNGEFDEFYLVYNKFKSAISQEPTIEKLVPLAMDDSEPAYGIDYIYEPSKEELLREQLPKFIAMQIYKAHLESLASELGSRMSAMDNATSNASDMIDRLSLKYNRARQAAITTELMDIVNGAEAIS